MTLFSSEKLRPRQIEIDDSTANCDSPEMRKRLDRIARNYNQLDQVLVDLESKLDTDERLAALDDKAFDFESEFGVKPKRKWRKSKPRAKTKKTSSQARAGKSKSGNPKKPR
jgi:hypothetical protein